MIRSSIAKLVLAYRKRKYRPGRRFRRSVGCDIMFEIEIVDASRLAEGILRIRSRGINTWVPDEEPGEFSEPRAVPLARLWEFETHVSPISDAL